jgi:DNA-directed RNA polymerase subunit RPC12/RpoP
MGSNWNETEDRGIEEGRKESNSVTYECSESAVCSECGTPFAVRRWTWKAMPKEPDEIVCPACRRIANRYPAGYIEVKGPFLRKHRDEILNLVREAEVQTRKEQPMERIMETVHDNDDILLITTTGILVARRIGEALLRSYEGNLYVETAEDEELIRVFWER